MQKQHDELYLQVIDPHFTLVFPAFNFLEAAFINHVRQVTQQIQASDELNAQSFEIVGRVEKLDVIWYENNRVGTIEKITLV